MYQILRSIQTSGDHEAIIYLQDGKNDSDRFVQIVNMDNKWETLYHLTDSSVWAKQCKVNHTKYKVKLIMNNGGKEENSKQPSNPHYFFSNFLGPKHPK